MLSELFQRATQLRDLLIHHSRLCLAALIVGACLLVTTTYSHFNATWDEPEHLASGMQLLDRGAYEYDVQHPTLARLAMALGPYLAGARAPDARGPSGEPAGLLLLYKSGHYDLYLLLARLGMLPFLAILLWSTWLWTRHLSGPGTALLATLMLAATPPILGHAGFAALDIPGAATCTLALYCLLRWYETQSWKFVALTGITAGLAVATKLSALPFIGVVGLAWLPCWWLQRQRAAQTAASASPPQSLRRWSGQCLSIVLLAVLCVLLTYSYKFRYTVTDAAPVNAAWAYVFGNSGAVHDLWQSVARTVPMPVGLERFVLSIKALLEHNKEGHLSYLLGQFNNDGFRHFYVVALAVKTPLPLLLLGVAGLAMLALQTWQRGWTRAAPTIAFVVLLGFCSFYSRINIGLRHVFILYPLLCLAAAICLVQLWDRTLQPRLQPALRAALMGAMAWQVSLLCSAHPDYLAYFNVTAGRHPEHVLIDSDLDWGQDIKRLRERLNERQVTRFAFVYRGTANVIGERLPGVWMAQPFQPTTGWVAASIYARDTVSQGEAFGWLRQYTPLERIGKSIDLYYIPPPPQP